MENSFCYGGFYRVFRKFIRPSSLQPSTLILVTHLYSCKLSIFFVFFSPRMIIIKRKKGKRVRNTSKNQEESGLLNTKTFY